MSNKISKNYLDDLNPQQREAVTYKDGPSLVIAGAGSGKTRVLTYKIVDLLRHGYEPYRILALTFTNKAAREMKERIGTLLGSEISSKLWMGTFHSIFLRILRTHAKEIGFKPGFTIYDSADSRSVIKMIVKDLGLDEKVYKPSVLANTISNAKNAMIDAPTYLQQGDLLEADRRAKRPLTGRIYQLYSERCHSANAMDFDDILFYMNILLKENNDICRHYQEFFKYILVDEYQDTNFAQHLVISQLAGDAHNLCVVGDDAQSIYSFRGANISNIINLEKRYAGLKIFKLERNYRSTQNIVNASGSLIRRNKMQLKKNVYSENEVGSPVEIVRTYSDMEEAYVVANLISKIRNTEHDSLEDFAILYRTNAQSRVLEESLRKRNIGYRIYGGLSFYQRKEIKDVISYFRLAANLDDDEALRRIINYPARGIGETTLRKLQSAAIERGISIWNVIKNVDVKLLNINAGTAKKLATFAELITLFTDENSNSNAYELGQLIYNRTGILTSLAHDNTPESISRQENLAELLSGLKDFVDSRLEEDPNADLSMEAFLSEISLATDQDLTDEEDDSPKVTLMTAHASKGLEFKHIFIVGVEEELFPSSLSMDSLSQIEEERRLLYVAMTRAMKSCTITYAGSRFRNGQTVISKPSRFLYELDPEFIKTASSADFGSDSSNFIDPISKYKQNTNTHPTISPSSHSKYSDLSIRSNETNRDIPRSSLGLKKISAKDSSNNSSNINPSLKPGVKISHQKLGIGTIEEVGNVSGQPSITVDFETSGRKRLLLNFAKFEILK